MRNRCLPVFLVLFLLGTTPGVAQLKKFRAKLKPKPAAEREERQRAKVEALATELYATDPDFREVVEEHYRQVLRQHSKRAYRINTSEPSQMVVVREDRFRRHPEGGLTLYDNLAIQSYVNRLGQRLAPAGASSLFTFRLVVTPVPYAEALSTGTVYLSTGLVALLENEAQLAYVLAHEMAHVYQEHWKWRSKLKFALDEFNERRQRSGWRRLVGGLAGGLAAGLVHGEHGTQKGVAVGIAVAQSKLNLEWGTAQENEADEIAFQAIQAANYDVREVGELYAKLNDTAIRDARVSVGFLGRKERLLEREAHTNELIRRALESPTSESLEFGYLIDTRRYKELMAELRRDNGIQALFYDMFHIARTNLRQAVEIRSNDPTSLYYYGKVLELVGRTDAELEEAKDLFRRAAENDFRNWNFGSHLHYALMLLDEGDSDRAEQELQQYIDGYSNYRIAEFAMRQLPSHVDTLFDYMMLSGRSNWTPILPQAPDGFTFEPGALATDADN